MILRSGGMEPMKLRTVCLAAMLVLLPLLSSTQMPAGARGPMTDAERVQALHIYPMIRPGAIAAKMLARGFVNGDGSKASGSPNWSVTFNGSFNRYEITINGVNYFFSSFTTVVTPALPKGGACATDSVSGKLLISCYDNANNPVPAYFGFATFGN
jgi:hypothetical protein